MPYKYGSEIPLSAKLAFAREQMLQVTIQFQSGLVTVREFKDAISRIQLPPIFHGEVDPNTGLKVSLPWPWPIEADQPYVRKPFDGMGEPDFPIESDFARDTHDPSGPGDGKGYYTGLDRS
jgi:hypothetical protein